MVRGLVKDDHLPDYRVELEDEMVIFRNRMVCQPKAEVRYPVLNPETYLHAKQVAPITIFISWNRNGGTGGWRAGCRSWAFLGRPLSDSARRVISATRTLNYELDESPQSHETTGDRAANAGQGPSNIGVKILSARVSFPGESLRANWNELE